ncbi:RodZ domain-containing protein [Candidatus Colwellia aromaticivorans]|uniref:RodZ domain-containing protein n=1 Tax=Candidatus Colwellia aromaticivorans TaxID=2267621 RepID=UPI000DF2D0D9|nr:RodZ domain-containing protein [Candidatus Colwellia aromaticivorans]
MNKEALTVASTKQVDELCEDIEVVGPGLMLSEARKKLSLSVEDVSEKLNFKRNVVNNIEQDIFDQSLPATFNRGYLRNYAKLVAVDIDEVLSAYDMLGIAEIQRSEMQSFSNLTVKQAEHSRLMWFSYLIAALLVGLMVLWWLQESKLSVNLFDKPKQEQQISDNVSDIADVNVAKKSVEAPESPKAEATELDDITKATSSVQKDLKPAISEQNLDAVLENQIETKAKAKAKTELVPEISTVVFTFSGDCWVNIYDATGERIAWGVKKSGYVMTISGKAPLKVTLGKPELAAIAFNGKQVDMSSFSVGNITKFTLPLSSQ